MRTVWIVIIAITLLPVTASADSYGKRRQLRGEYVSRELQVCAQENAQGVLVVLRNTIRTIERVYDGKGGGTATLLTQNIDLQKELTGDPSMNPFRNLFVRAFNESDCDIVEVYVARDLSVKETLICEGQRSGGGVFRFSTTREGQLTRNRSVMNYGVNPAERQVLELWDPPNSPELNPDDPDRVVLRDCIIEGTAIKKIKKRIRRDDDDENEDDDDDDD